MNMVLDANQDVIGLTLKHKKFAAGSQRSELEAGPCQHNQFESTGETKHYFKMDFTFLCPK